MSDIDGIIDQSAAQYRLDPDLLRAMVRVESGGNPSAVSPKGAVGLMQIMPDTAVGMGIDPADLTRPEINIPAGASYMRQMIDKFGNLDHAVQAFNMGPGAMEAYLAGNRAMPSETANYLTSVSGNFSRLKQGAAPMPTPTTTDNNDPIMAMIQARAAGQVLGSPTSASDAMPSAPAAAPAGDNNSPDAIMQMIQARARGEVLGQPPAAGGVTTSRGPDGVLTVNMGGTPAQAAAPATDEKSPIVEGIEGLGRFGRGVYQGVTQDWLAGYGQQQAHEGQQILAEIDSLLGTNLAQQAGPHIKDLDAQVRQREADYQAATPGSSMAGGGRVVGNILPMFVGGPEAAVAPIETLAKGAGNLAARAGVSDFMQTVARLLGGAGANAVEGAGLGGIQPVMVNPAPASPTEAVTGQYTGNDYFEQAHRNAGGGAVIGFGVPLAFNGAGAAVRYGGRALKAAVAPFTEGGQEGIADAMLQRYAAGGPNAANASEIVPGSTPTLAEATGNSGIATLQRTMRDLNTNPFVAREEANAQARLDAFHTLAGDPSKVKSMIAQRDDIAEQLYGQAIANYQGKVTPRLQDEIDELLERPSIKEGVAIARKWALERNEQPTPEGSLGSLHDVKQYLDDRIAKAVKNEAMREATLLQDTRDKLLHVMEQMSPEYKAARETYARMSKPIDAAQTLQSLRLTDQMGNITLGHVQQAIRSIQDKINKPGVNAAQALDKKQLDVLTSIRDDLMRAKNTELGKTAGPTTAQNLATQNILSQMVPGRMGKLAAQMPSGTIGAGLGTGLGFLAGGPLGAAAGATIGGSIGKRFTTLANLHDDLIQEAIVRKLLDPNAGLAAIAPTNTNGVPAGVLREIARRLLIPGLTAPAVRGVSQ
jgi:Transglycosylase SLT domain